MSDSHEPFDESTKVFYRRFFENKGLLVETEREVFFRARKIDLVVNCSQDDINRLENTVFSHFRWLNALELKGPQDPLTLKDYNRILMRAWGLGGLEEKDEAEEETEVEYEEEEESTSDDFKRLPSHRTLTIVCVTKPRKILNTLEKELRFSQTEPGIYHCEAGQIQRWIICPSELLLVEKNYPLLPLARGDKLVQFISICVRDGLVEYLKLIKDIGLVTEPNLIWQKILEIQDMKPEIREETWSYIDRFFQEMPYAMTKLPSLQKTFQDAVQQAVQQSIQKAIQDAAQEASAENQKRVLIRQLRRKFASVPKKVVQKIEATDNSEQLDNWLDQIIVADSLAKIEWGTTGKSDNT
jgi:predicted SPOUT superfamily RNA methylase MTH1